MDTLKIEASKILNHGKDGVLIVNESRVITYANISAREILEYDDLFGQPVHDVFRIYNYYTKEPYNNFVDEVFQTERPTGLLKESAIRTGKDHYFFVSASISPIIENGVKGVVIFFKDISRLKNTELELSKFRKAIENSIEAVVITDGKWDIEYLNDRSQKRLGQSDVILKSNFWDTAKYNITWMEKEVMYEDLEKDKYWVGDVRGDSYDEKWYRVSIVALTDVIGNIINYVISEVDVTFEKESQRLLINERKNLSTIVNGAPIGMMTVTKEYGVLQINEECRSVLGVPLSRPQNILSMVEEYPNLHIVIELIGRVLKSDNEVRGFEFFLIKEEHDKKTKSWIKANAVPIDITEKRCVLLSFEDETVKKDMARTIARNERQLRLVTDNMQDIIIQISILGKIEYYSSSYQNMIGPTKESLINQSIINYIYDEDHEILRRMMLKCKDSQGNIKFEIRFINAMKEPIWVEVMMKLIENDENDVSFILYGRDVTQRRIAEQEIVHSKEIAIAANNAKSEFLANMSHEIRTPLNGIIGMANIALMQTQDSKQKDNVSMIKHSAENLLKIINSVLDFSKIEAGKLTIEAHSMDLNEELNKFIKPFKIQASQKDINLEMFIDEKICPTLEGDITRVIQVVTNLIGNAIKFTEFGDVKFSVICFKEDNETQWIRFLVKDTGIGIKDEDKHKIFQSFSQADGSVTRKFGGTGLGLNITKKIVELMNGTIGFSSKYGEGSEFICTLPFKKDFKRKTTTHEEATIKNEAIGVGYNILVVEDDKINQKLAQRLLKRKGYGITMVNNGQEALDIYEDGRFDLILMDIQMPIMDGLTATRLIREKAQDKIPIIALTAYAIKGDKEKFLKKGMDDYISKPIDLDDFYRILDFHLKAKKNDDHAIQRILEKLNVDEHKDASDERKLFNMHYEKMNMQLKYIASSINKGEYEKLEERCYAFKNFVTSIKMHDLRKLVFTLELHIRKENELEIVKSYQAIIDYINARTDDSLKGVEIHENINR
ncbi:MAG: response regulator [Clostridia bacterium]|nr:response regulator [Clostridia bacterium]